MSSSPSSLVVRVLSGLATALERRPGWFVWPQLVLFVASVLGTVLGLRFEMDRNALVGEDKHYHRIFLDFRREFAGQDDIVVLVESEDAEKNRQFIERLGARLEAESVRVNPAHVFGDIFYKGDLRAMGNKALLFFPETNLVEFAGALEKYRPFMQGFTGATNLESVFRQVNTLIRQAGRERKAGTEEEFAQMLPAMERLVRMAGESLARPGIPPSPGVEALFGGGAEAERQKYLTFANGRLYLLSTRPRQVEVQAADLPPTLWERLLGRRANPTPTRLKDFQRARQGSVNSDAVDRVRALVAEVQQEVPGLNVGVTGEQVLDHDEMHQSQADSTRATLLALVICLGIFVAGYRQVWRPLKAMACLVIGLGYTMGYTTLVIGHLNILTVTFVPMLVGLAIDFGVHLISRYEEELGRGRPETESMRLAVVFTGQGIFTGCFTTAGAFFAMALTGFRGIREMGVITGGGMLLCLVPMITLLPIWLRPGRRSSPTPAPAPAPASGPAARPEAAAGPAVAAVDQRERLERLWLDRPWTVLGVAAAGCLAAALVLPRIHFDYNLLNMQSRGLPAVEFEHKLIEGAEKSVLYAAVVTNSLEGAVALEDRLRQLPTVASTDSMARFLREDATRKLAQAQQVKAAVAGFQFAPVDPAPVILEDLSRRVFALQGYLALATDEVNRSGPTNLVPRLRSLSEALARFRADIFRGDREANARKLAAFQRAFLQDLRDTVGALQQQDVSGALRVEDLPPSLRHRFVGRTGRHLIQIYPRSNVWERLPQEAFVRELRTVIPDVTGTPVQLFEYTTLLKESYEEAAGWALAAIVLLVFIHFRSLTAVLLALLPVAVGALWMVGFMGWNSIPFNPANIMTLPLVIGIGVTNGIHILNRFAEERNPGILAKSTGKAVLVSGLTTIAGFGALITGQHQGIQSLGWVMSTGTATCMVAGLTVLPALLTLRGRRSRPGSVPA